MLRCSALDLEFPRLRLFVSPEKRKIIKVNKYLFLALFLMGCDATVGMRQIVARDYSDCPESNIRITQQNLVYPGATFTANVCGNVRRYQYIDSVSGNETGQYVDITEGVPSNCSTRPFRRTTEARHETRIEFFISGHVERCMTEFQNEGWNIASSRRAHNGDYTTGWGMEVVFQR